MGFYGAKSISTSITNLGLLAYWAVQCDPLVNGGTPTPPVPIETDDDPEKESSKEPLTTKQQLMAILIPVGIAITILGPIIIAVIRKRNRNN